MRLLSLSEFINEKKKKDVEDKYVFDVEFEEEEIETLEEANRPPTQQEKDRMQREAYAKLKESATKAIKAIHDDPEKSDLHKAELALINAKIHVLDLKDTLDKIKAKYKK